MNRICPSCGSKDIAKILYGKPFFDEELEKALEEKKIKLGGCTITGHDPKYYCNLCETFFDTDPWLIINDIKEVKYHYRSWNNSMDIHISRGKKNNLIINENRYHKKDYNSIMKWDTFIIKLISTKFLDWNDSYINTDILDVINFELTVILYKGETIERYGSNHFPPHFKKLRTMINKIIQNK